MPPTLCLNMIVKNEAHVIGETLRCITPYIDTWVIVDTGSTDDTRAVIRRHFERAGIPGELHDRPWRDFGTNRTEALQLCQGVADYAWVIDADDLIVGDLVLPELEHDCYLLKYGSHFRYWRSQIFRDPAAWRYVGVLHEYPQHKDGDRTEAQIRGDYHIKSRRLGDRSRTADKYEQDSRVLREALEREPDNQRYVFYLAQSYFDQGDYVRSLEQYQRRATLGAWVEEVFYSLLRVAKCRELLGEPWDQVLGAYLAAYEYRPLRAEPLYEIALHYRLAEQYALAYAFAKLATEIPFPPEERLFINKQVYDYRAKDERAISAFYTGRPQESFDLCRALLAEDRASEGERARIVKNRDFAVEHVKDQHLRYPEKVAKELTRRARQRAGNPRCHVTLTITSCKRLDLFCDTVNSFLNTCSDVLRIARWICIDDNSDEGDRRHMAEHYPFFEFVWKGPSDKGHAHSMNALLTEVQSPRWIHLEDDWHFFDARDYVGDALAVLADRRNLGQVLFNRNYGEALTCRDIVGGQVRHTKKQGLRYRLHEHIPKGTEAYTAHYARQPAGALSNVYWPHYSLRPSMLKTAAISKVGAYEPQAAHFELDFAERYAALGLRSAFFDEITALHLGRRNWERDASDRPNAYKLNEERQFIGDPSAS